jgi:hypothetical protein
MSMMVPEVATKRLQLLKEALPGISRVLVLSYLADPIAPLQVKAMQRPPNLKSRPTLSTSVATGQEERDIPAAPGGK